MSNTVTITTLSDSASLTKLHVYLASDGSSGELSSTVIFDASALVGANNAGNIMEIQGCLNGFSGTLKFSGNTAFPAVVLPQDRPFCFNFETGYPPNKAGTPDGDIQMATSGFTASGDVGFFTITVKKDVVRI